MAAISSALKPCKAFTAEYPLFIGVSVLFVRAGASIRTAREVFRGRNHLKLRDGCLSLVLMAPTKASVPTFFKNLRRKYVGHLARTLKKIPPAGLTQGGGAMQSLEK